jgi:hypothetical protein
MSMYKIGLEEKGVGIRVETNLSELGRLIIVEDGSARFQRDHDSLSS